MDYKQVALKITEAEWPEGKIEPDELIGIVNATADYLKEIYIEDDEESMYDEANNFIIWLGGQHPDLAVYAMQLMRRLYHMEIFANDEASVRLQRWEMTVFHRAPYRVEKYEDIHNHRWPRQFTKSWEERLDDLAEEFALEEGADTVTADMVLNGLHRGSLTAIEALPLVTESLQILTDLDKQYPRTYGENHFIVQEKMDNLVEWLKDQDIELQIMGIRAMITVFKLFVPIPRYKDFIDPMKDLVMAAAR